MTTAHLRILATTLAIGALGCSSDDAGTSAPQRAGVDAGADVGLPDAAAEASGGEAAASAEAGAVDAPPAQDAHGDGASADECLMQACMGELTACMGDEVCKGWMECIQSCGEDKMKCPTFCGLYYPSPLENDFIACALENECLSIDFSSYPSCEVPSGELEDLSGMGGTWWFAQYHGEDYLFDYDCQKLSFEEISPTELEVAYSVPLTHEGQSQVCETHGTFRQRDDGSVLIEYESFLGYHEDWYIVYKTDAVLVAHVCFASDGDTKNYGTLVVSRGPLDELDAPDREALDEAIETKLGLSPQDFTAASMSGCANAD